MRLLPLFSFCLMAYSGAALPRPSAKPDTLPTKASAQDRPKSRQASPLMIMPGTRLDLNFRTIPAQSLAVGKAAPAWLRAKAGGSPVYVVNGKVATVAQLNALRQADVASVNVLDGSRAATLYGRNARHGMVIVTTKAGLAPGN